MVEFDPGRPEVWYPIPMIPGYEISSHLRVRSVRPHRFHHHKPPRIIKIQIDARGYRKLSVSHSGRCHNHYLHHIVAELAHGPRPDGHIVCHRDDDKSNNWPANLYYGTPSENNADSKRNGRFRPARGERQGKARLTELQVRAARQLDKMGVPRRLIAYAVGISPKNISSIITGKLWSHVKDDVDLLADGRAYAVADRLAPLG